MKPKVWINSDWRQDFPFIFNQPVEPPHPGRRKGEKEKVA